MPVSRQVPERSAGASSAISTTARSSDSSRSGSSSSWPKSWYDRSLAGAARLHELERELDEALDDLRSLAHGVYPSLLADRGLVDALRSVAGRSKLSITLNTNDVERYGAAVESAVYFCVLEALQNVLKHARAARRIVVKLDGGAGTELTFSVRDDGLGTPDLRVGAGITNMRDRLAQLTASSRSHRRRASGRWCAGGRPRRRSPPAQRLSDWWRLRRARPTASAACGRRAPACEGRRQPPGSRRCVGEFLYRDQHDHRIGDETVHAARGLDPYPSPPSGGR